MGSQRPPCRVSRSPCPWDPGNVGGRPSTEAGPMPRIQSLGGPPHVPSPSLQSPTCMSGACFAYRVEGKPHLTHGTPPPRPPSPFLTLSALLMARLDFPFPPPLVDPPSVPLLMPSALFPSLLVASPLLPCLPRGFGGGVAALSRRERFLDWRMTLFSWQCCHARHRGA